MKTVSIFIILSISNTSVCFDWKKSGYFGFFEFKAKNFHNEKSCSFFNTLVFYFYEDDFILDLRIQNFLWPTFNIILLLFYFKYFIYVY